VLADATEALLAVVYQERGLDGARALVADMIRESLTRSDRLEARDPKSELQERVQAAGRPAPTYRIVETRGLPHDPIFVVEVVIEGATARGEGTSKRMAERAAAEVALVEMSDDPNSRA
jgi:ribonuclease-3